MSLDFFCTVMPLRRTSSGSRGSAIFTRLLTLTVAVSTLVPTSKVAVMVSAPLLDADEVEIQQPSDAVELFLDRRRDGTGDSVSALAPA